MFMFLFVFAKKDDWLKSKSKFQDSMLQLKRFHEALDVLRIFSNIKKEENAVLTKVLTM